MKEKILPIIIMTLLILAISITNVNATYNVTTGVSKRTVEIGDSITVTVNLSQAVGQAQIYLNYDSSLVRFESSSIKGIDKGNSIKAIQLSMDSANLQTITFKFTAIAEGTANFSLGSVDLGDANSNEIAQSEISIGDGQSVTVSKKQEVNTNPGTTNPGTTNPGTTNPGTTNPGTTNPETTNPGTTNPGTTNPGTTNPGTTNEPTFRTDNSTVYAKNNVNIRSGWTTAENNILTVLKKGEEITRTGISDEWDRVTYNGRTAYIRHGYLTTEKPDETDEDNNELDGNVVDDNVITNNEIDNSINENVNNIENNVVTTSNTTNQTNAEKKGISGKLVAIIISVSAVVIATIIIIVIYKKTNEEEEEDEEVEEVKPNTRTNTRNSTIKNTTTRNSSTRSGTTRSGTTRNSTSKSTTKTTNGKK